MAGAGPSTIKVGGISHLIKFRILSTGSKLLLCVYMLNIHVLCVQATPVAEAEEVIKVCLVDLIADDLIILSTGYWVLATGYWVL